MAYATALEAAGVDVTHTHYDGAIHGFSQMTTLSALARDAMDRCCAFLRSSLG